MNAFNDRVCDHHSTRQERKGRIPTDERGATMVEFVFTAGLTFALIWVTIEAALAGHRTLTVQYVASDIARKLVVGGTPLPDLQANGAALGTKLGVPMNATDIQICRAKDLLPNGNCPAPGLGRKNEFIAVRISSRYNFFFSSVFGSNNLGINVEGIALGKREPTS